MVSRGRRCCDVEVVVVEDVVRGCVVSPNRVLAAIGLECFPSDFSQLRTTFFFLKSLLLGSIPRLFLSIFLLRAQKLLWLVSISVFFLSQANFQL